jgi:hypothetical protein
MDLSATEDDDKGLVQNSHLSYRRAFQTPDFSVLLVVTIRYNEQY